MKFFFYTLFQPRHWVYSDLQPMVSCAGSNLVAKVSWVESDLVGTVRQVESDSGVRRGGLGC